MSMTTTACNNFRPNIWRPTTCADCFRPRSQHTSLQSHDGNVGYDQLARQSPMTTTTSSDTEQRRIAVGIVKPYAVVDIPEELRRRYSEPTIHVRRTNTVVLKARNTVGNLFHDEEKSSSTAEYSDRLFSSRTQAERRMRSASLSFPYGKRPPILPKRRAPLPPHTEKPEPRTVSTAHPIHSNSTQRLPSHPRPRAATFYQTPLPCPRPRAATVHQAAVPCQKPHATTLDQAPLSAQSPRTTILDQATAFPCPRPHATTIHQAALPRSKPCTTTLGQAALPNQRPHATTLDQATALPCPRPRATTIHQAALPHSKARTTTLGQAALPDQRPRATTLDQTALPYSKPRPTTLATVKTVVQRRKVPPQKPPRTLSTFISPTEQESLLMQLANDERQSSNNETAPVSQPVASSPPVLVTPVQLQSCISKLMVETLESVCNLECGGLVCRENLWQVTWKDLDVHTSTSGTTASYKGTQLTFQQCVSCPLEEGTEQEITLSRLLAPHPHLSLVRAVLTTPPPFLPSHSSPTSYIIRDCINGEPLNQLLPKLRQSLSQQDYTEHILLCLVQVFSALSYLHSNGVCHRDVGLDCLFATPHGDHWLVRLSAFDYALNRPGPVTATSFVYGYHELKWLGGADSRLPPEIMDTPEEAQTVDYSRTDCFAVGCIMYEMMGLKNPFESDPDLVYKSYTEADLPRFTHTSPFLQHLADLLLTRDPQRRLEASTALLITQAHLWLPGNRLREPVPAETQLSHHLVYERAQLVACLAKTAPSLPLLLKAQFLLSCNTSELIGALSLSFL